MIFKKDKNENVPDKLVTSIKKEVKFLDIVLILLFGFIMAFTIYIAIMSYRTMYEPTALITAVFAFVGAECGFAAGITKRKMSLKDREYDKYNEQDNRGHLDETDIEKISDKIIDIEQIKQTVSTEKDKDKNNES